MYLFIFMLIILCLIEPPFLDSMALYAVSVLESENENKQHKKNNYTSGFV